MIMYRLLAAAALLAFAVPGFAQEQNFDKIEIKTEDLGPGIAILFGAGGNIGVSYGPDGIFLVDDQYGPLTDKILAAVKALDPGAVRFVVNTHWHGDHSGGNENIRRAGAAVLAHENARERMSKEQYVKSFDLTIPASPAAALPMVTFGDGLTLYFNGDILHVIHVPAAHTDGDIFVKWEHANVIHAGDLYVRYGLPFFDVDSGGSIDGFIAAIDKIISLSDANTRIIPGHGEVASRTDIEAYKAMLVDLRDKVAADIARDQTLEQIKAADYTSAYALPDGFFKPDKFIAAIYNSLNAASSK